jgi:hypothetical protein
MFVQQFSGKGFLMTVYIIRPKTTSVARSLKLASRKFTAESRP